jgi:hypothetical protein
MSLLFISLLKYFSKLRGSTIGYSREGDSKVKICTAAAHMTALLSIGRTVFLDISKPLRRCPS